MEISEDAYGIAVISLFSFASSLFSRAYEDFKVDSVEVSVFLTWLYRRLQLLTSRDGTNFIWPVAERVLAIMVRSPSEHKSMPNGAGTTGSVDRSGVEGDVVSICPECSFGETSAYLLGYS